MKNMINFEQGKYYSYPYPYMVMEECFEQDILENLIKEYPDVSDVGSVMGGRKQMGTHGGQNTTKCERWLQTVPTWNRFYNWLNSDSNLHSILGYYEDQLTNWQSNVDQNSSFNTDCFTHVDWSSATDGYKREIHTDSSKRIWNFLIFFNDKDWEGGDFLIHSSDDLDRNLPSQVFDNKTKVPVHKTFEAKKNRGIFFLSTPESYHSVSEQINTKTPRKFIYGSYSYRNGDVFRKRTK